MEDLTTIFKIIILIMSVIIHELSHGFTAELLGDPTPRMQGRLTLNPFKHLDFLGSFVVPIITTMAGFTFGWAKPVEWNPYNVKNKRWGEFLISLAGPSSNILIAVVFGLIIRFYSDILPGSSIYIATYIVIINIVLPVFNLIPLPPLDGSKVLFSFLPIRWYFIREILETYSILFFLIVAVFLWQFIEPIIPIIFKVITGVSL
jgi:Zn-dependent protease